MKTLRFYCREIGAALLIVLVLEMLSRGLFRPIIGSPLYFTTMISFYRTLMLCLIFLALFTAVPSLRPYREIFLFLSVFVLGYFVAEILYRSFHPKLSLIYRSSSQVLTFYHLDYFFIHRLYQLMPLLFLGLLFKSYPGGYFSQYLRWGDWNTICDTRHLITGKQKSRTWREISIFFLAILACGLILFAVMTFAFNVPPRIAKPIGASGVLPLLSAIFLYAVTAAVVEESFFRGFFLSLFSKVMGDVKGNIYQALIFGALHIDIASPIRSIAKLIVFSFIGWLWGKAAKETGGIGCSLMMHFGVLIALELRVYFLM